MKGVKLRRTDILEKEKKKEGTQVTEMDTKWKEKLRQKWDIGRVGASVLHECARQCDSIKK